MLDKRFALTAPDRKQNTTKTANNTNHLSMKKAREIRELFSKGAEARELSVRYGVSITAVRRVLRGEVYKEDE